MHRVRKNHKYNNMILYKYPAEKETNAMRSLPYRFLPVREDHVVGTWRRADDIDAFANMIGVLLGEDCTSIEFEINRINF